MGCNVEACAVGLGLETPGQGLVMWAGNRAVIASAMSVCLLTCEAARSGSMWCRTGLEPALDSLRRIPEGPSSLVRLPAPLWPSTHQVCNPDNSFFPDLSKVRRGCSARVGGAEGAMQLS
jgi:hypothetical protein